MIHYTQPSNRNVGTELTHETMEQNRDSWNGYSGKSDLISRCTRNWKKYSDLCIEAPLQNWGTEDLLKKDTKPTHDRTMVTVAASKCKTSHNRRL